MSFLARLIGLELGEEEGEDTGAPDEVALERAIIDPLRGSPKEAIVRVAEETFPDDEQAQQLFIVLAAAEQLPTRLASRQRVGDPPEEVGVARGLTQVEAETAANILLSAIINRDKETVEAILGPLLTRPEPEPREDPERMGEGPRPVVADAVGGPVDAAPEPEPAEEEEVVPRYMVGGTAPVTSAEDLMNRRRALGLTRTAAGQRAAQDIIEDYLDYAEQAETQGEKDERRLAYEKAIFRQRVKDLTSGLRGASFRAAGGEEKLEALEAMSEPLERFEEKALAVLGMVEEPEEASPTTVDEYVPATVGEIVPLVFEEEDVVLDDDEIRKLLEVHEAFNAPGSPVTPATMRRKLEQFE